MRGRTKPKFIAISGFCVELESIFLQLKISKKKIDTLKPVMLFESYKFVKTVICIKHSKTCQ